MTRPTIEYLPPDDLADRVRQKIAPVILDGTEAYAILEELARGARDANGDTVKNHAALVRAKTRMRVLLKDCVPVEAVLDAIGCRLPDEGV